MMLDEPEPKDKPLAQAKLLIRSAMWISVMDDAGGNNSDLLERATIRDTLRGFMNEPDYKSLIPVFQTALESHKAWGMWAKDLSGLVLELKSVAPMLPLEFCQCIYDLAYSVAKRYRERGWLSSLFVAIGRSLKNFASPGPQSPELEDYLNISPLERNALNELAAILGMPQRIIT